MGEFQVLKDHKREIEFWLNTLSHPNLEEGTILLLNQCLQMEIRQYLNPYVPVAATSRD